MIHVEAVDGVRWLRLNSGKVQALDLELTTALTDEVFQLRGPHIEALQRHGAAMDEDVLRAWQSPETLAAIRSYLERTFEKR